MLDVDIAESRIGLVTYSSSATNPFFMEETTNADDISEQVLAQQQDSRDDRNTYRGLRAMADDQFVDNKGDREFNPNIGIVITLGQPDREDRIADEIEAVLDKNINVISVGVDPTELDEDIIAEMSGGDQELNKNYFIISDFVDLAESMMDHATDIATQICTREDEPATTTTTQPTTTTVEEVDVHQG